MSTEAEERPRVYLNSVHLKGFKSIEDLTIDFKKGLNILIGKNGAGKSNLMELLFQTIQVRHIKNIQYNYAQLEFVSADEHSFTLELEKILRDVIFERDDLVDRIGLFERFSVDNKIVFDNSGNEDVVKTFNHKNKKITYRGSLRGLFLSMGYLPLFPLYLQYNLPDKLYCIDIPGTLKIDLDGQFTYWNYPDTLSFIYGIFWNIEKSYGVEFDKIPQINQSIFFDNLIIQDPVINNLKLYTNIEDLRFSNNINLYKDEKHVIIENIKLEFKINGHWLPWSQLSDGTKRLFYIIAEVTYTDALVLLEEPELGIHPHQFNLLMNFLKEQAEDKQIIISTHSPKALDHLSPEELDHILIVYYDLEKGTQIRHLSDKEIVKAQRYMKEVGYFSDYWMYSDLE